MIQLKTIVISFLLSCPCSLANDSVSQEAPALNGHFEGTEPFWSMDIENNRVILHCINDTLTDTVQISRKQLHSETYAFKGNQLFGIIRRSGKGGCTLDITEGEAPTHEIYFSYKNETYMGCGGLKPEPTASSPDLHNLIRHAAWKTVRQTLRSKDAKKDRTITIGPDDPVNYIPNIHFRDGNKFVMINGKKTVNYDYRIQDSVLTY